METIEPFEFVASDNCWQVRLLFQVEVDRAWHVRDGCSGHLKCTVPFITMIYIIYARYAS